MTFDLRDVSVRHPASSVRGGADALSGLSLRVEAGEQVALIGPSGAGKTTLLHTLALALKPRAGIVNAFGVDPWSLGNAARHALRARLFLAPQTPPLPPRQRVVTAVLAGRLPQWSLRRALASLVKPADTQRAWDALAQFHLQDKLYARVDRLSGGERQRTGIARALVSSAEAFLVDEPLSALDPTLARQTMAVLQREAAARGAALVCSLHQVEIARALFPRLVGLREGRILFDARSQDVTDAMIAALYRQAAAIGPTVEDISDRPIPPPAVTPRCF